MSDWRAVALLGAALLASACPARKPKPPAPPPEAPPPLAESPLPPSGEAQFEIAQIDWKRSEDARELYVEGTVRNIGTRSSRDLKVWVDGLDVNGIQLARTEALPTPQEIPPGASARFVVRMPNDPAIRTFHVEAIGR